MVLASAGVLCMLAGSMVSLKLQKRLASSVLQCGLRKVWLDPNEVNDISMANSSEQLCFQQHHRSHVLRHAAFCLLLCSHLRLSLHCHCAGQNIRKLVKDGFVIRKPQKIHSRARARDAAEAKSKGRHMGYGACCNRRQHTGCHCNARGSGSRCLVPSDLRSWCEWCCAAAQLHR